MLNCKGGRLSRGEEILPDFHKVGGENGTFWGATCKLSHSIDKFYVFLLTINLSEIDI